MADFLLTVGVDTEASYDEFQKGIANLVKRINDNPPKVKLDFGVDDGGKALSSLLKEISESASAAVRPLHDISKAVSEINNKNFDMNLSFNDADTGAQALGAYVERVRDYVRELGDAYTAISRISKTAVWKSNANSTDNSMLAVAAQEAQTYESALKKLEDRLNRVSSFAGAERIAKDAQSLWNNVIPLLERAQELKIVTPDSKFGIFPEIPKDSVDTASRFANLLGTLRDGAKGEAESVGALNDEYKEHAGQVEAAAKAEQAKILKSVELTGKLEKESEALEDATKSATKHSSGGEKKKSSRNAASGDMLKQVANAVREVDNISGGNLIAAMSRTNMGVNAAGVNEFTNSLKVLRDVLLETDRQTGNWDSAMKTLGLSTQDIVKHLHNVTTGAATMKQELRESVGSVTIDQVRKLSTELHNLLDGNETLHGTDSRDRLDTFVKELDSIIDSFGQRGRNLSETIQNMTNPPVGSENLVTYLERVKSAMIEFKNLAVKEPLKVTDAREAKILADYEIAVKKNAKAERDWAHVRNSTNQSSKDAISRLQEHYAALEKARRNYDKSDESARKLESATRLYNKALSDTNIVLKTNGDLTLTLTQRLQQAAARFGIWFSASRVFMGVIRGIRQMIDASIELDNAMAQMQIVTRASNKEMEEFAENAGRAAQRIGSSIKDFTDSATTFARLGYSTSESSMLAEYTAMLQNVGDIDVQDAQNAITAIIKAFGTDVSDIESIMDKLVTTGNNFPISVSQIAEGMNNASSALAAAGNTFEQSVALLTAANTTIQNASKSSTGLRTIAARLRNTKNELDELGESFESDAKYEELVNSLTKANVTLKTATGEFRSTYDIIADIAKVWDQLTSMEQAGLATAISGTRQQAVFFSLVEQFKEASGAMDEMANSSGALTDAYGIYMDTVQAHVNQFKAAFESLSQTFVDKGFVNTVIDIGRHILSLVEALAKLINVVGGLKTVIAGLAIGGIVAALPKIVTVVSGFVSAVQVIPTAIALLNGGLMTFSEVVAGIGISAGQFVAIAASVVAAVGAVIGIVKFYKNAIDEMNPSVEMAKENYEEQKKSLESLRSEYEKNADRIKELTAIASSDNGLNIVEQDELRKLKEENELLEDQIELEEKLADESRKTIAAKAKDDARSYLDQDLTTTRRVRGSKETVKNYNGSAGVTNLIADYNDSENLKERTRILGELVEKRKELIDLRGNLMLDEDGNAGEIARVNELIDSIDLVNDRAGVFNRVFNRFFEDGGFTDEKVKEFTEYLERIGYDTEHISKESLIEYFDGVGRASEESAGSLKDTVDQLEKLAEVEKNFDSISGAISDYEKNGFVSAQKLQSLEEVYGGTEGWEDFKRVLSDTKSTIDDVRAASNKLAENWVNSNGKIRDALNGVTEENADATKAMLENMGVVNAEALVEQTLTAKRLEAQAASMGLTDATWEEVSAKLAAAGASKDALGALEAYRKQQVSAKLATMDFTTATKDSISALYAQAAAANASQRALGAIKSVQAIKDSTAGLDRKSSAYGNAMRAMAQYQNIVKEEFSAAIPDTIVAPKVVIPSSGGGSGSKSGSKSAAKDLELYTAEIERYREELEKLSRIRIHKEDLNFAIEEEKDLEKKVNLYHAIITAYSEEQKSLERLQALRRKDISSGVADLRGMGFSVEYSAKNDELFIRNKEHINELYGKNTEETNELRKAAEALIKDLEDLNKENQEGADTWQELGKAANSAKVAMIDTLKEIVTNASGAVDAIQNVYSTLHKAADEFAANGGFISVDTFQEIIGLGAQYMQYLTDENGLLVINEDSINKVIAAKTEELALDTAMSYVERLRLAMQDDSVESLNELLYATQDTANATWDLVYANLKMLGLNDQQYAAALHNINGIRAMARAAINGVGHVAGEALEELKNMEKGTGDILKYVMDMLKQRIQDEIDALEDLKDQFGDLIDLKKESLNATKEESDYQKKVAQRIKEIAKLQAQIDALSLDNSRESQARRAKLLEELAQMQEDLDNEQTEHAISAQEESLDKMKEMYDAEKDEEIKTLEDTISSYQKLYDMA